MNNQENFGGLDMSDWEYRAKVEAERAREAFYAEQARAHNYNARPRPAEPSRFSSDGDDVDLMY